MTEYEQLEGPILGWHTISEDHHTTHKVTLVEIGKTLKVDYPDEIAPCEYGYHSCVDPNVLITHYATGPVICRVVSTGLFYFDRDKLVASERTCIGLLEAAESIKLLQDYGLEMSVYALRGYLYNKKYHQYHSHAQYCLKQVEKAIAVEREVTSDIARRRRYMEIADEFTRYIQGLPVIGGFNYHRSNLVSALQGCRGMVDAQYKANPLMCIGDALHQLAMSDADPNNIHRIHADVLSAKLLMAMNLKADQLVPNA